LSMISNNVTVTSDNSSRIIELESAIKGKNSFEGWLEVFIAFLIVIVLVQMYHLRKKVS
jgi:hypothetical protein